MKKKVIVIVSTDKHLQLSNTDAIVDLCKQEIDLCRQTECSQVLWLGDIFDSRTSQRQELLTTLDKILTQYSDNGITLTCIVGNHDKTDYNKSESFLTAYKHYPNFNLIEEPTIKRFGEFNFALLPFFSDEIWMSKWFSLRDQLKQLDNSKTFVCSHIAVQGSRNNDGTTIESAITPSLFEEYFKVLLGHYHNQQKIGKNVYHLPSTQQNNFGEDADKGFVVVYDDGSHELIKSKFKEFKTVSIDVEKISKKDLNKLIVDNTNQEGEIRFELKGSRTSLDAFKASSFIEKGISIVKRVAELEDVDEVTFAQEVVELSGENVKEKFSSFCKEKKYKEKDGIVYLNKVIKN